EPAHRREQLLTRAQDAAAEHDDLGLEQVRDRRDAGCERLARLVPDPRCDRVARARARRDVGGRGVFHAGLFRALGDRRARGVRLETAAPAAAAALPAVPVDGDVAKLTAVAALPAVQAAADHDAATDTRRHREVDHVLRAAPGAVAVLAGCAR